LEVADYQFAAERDRCGPPSSDELKAKRPKNEILDNSKFTELLTAFNKNYRSNMARKDIAFMDITLQNRRAFTFATQLIKNLVFDITGGHQSSGQPAEVVGKNHATTNRTAVTPITVTTIKTDPINPNPLRKLFPTARSATQTFEWQGKPTNERNHRINAAAFLKTIPSVFPTAQDTIDLHCRYTDNTRVTLETLLAILDATIPPEFMDEIFASDHTFSPNTINLIFKTNNADKHFQFRDYARHVPSLTEFF
jgi:hypothetical protein